MISINAKWKKQKHNIFNYVKILEKQDWGNMLKGEYIISRFIAGSYIGLCTFLFFSQCFKLMEPIWTTLIIW